MFNIDTLNQYCIFILDQWWHNDIEGTSINIFYVILRQHCSLNEK